MKTQNVFTDDVQRGPVFFKTNETFAFFVAEPDRARLLLREALDRPAQMRALLSKYVAPWLSAVSEALVKGKAAGVFRADVVPEAYVVMVIHLVLGTVATFNVVYLLMTVLTAYCTFLLARHVTGRSAEAWLAGLLAGRLAPERVARYAEQPYALRSGDATFAARRAAARDRLAKWRAIRRYRSQLPLLGLTGSLRRGSLALAWADERLSGI